MSVENLHMYEIFPSHSLNEEKEFKWEEGLKLEILRGKWNTWLLNLIKFRGHPVAMESYLNRADLSTYTWSAGELPRLHWLSYFIHVEIPTPWTSSMNSLFTIIFSCHFHCVLHTMASVSTEGLKSAFIQASLGDRHLWWQLPKLRILVDSSFSLSG